MGRRRAGVGQGRMATGLALFGDSPVVGTPRPRKHDETARNQINACFLPSITMARHAEPRA
jgi:predicted RNA methylase